MVQRLVVLYLLIPAVWCFCRQNEIRCIDGKCVSTSKFMDQVKDCIDGKYDEKILYWCDSTQLNCANGTCISRAKFQNGVNDCGDNSDEVPHPCMPPLYTCSGPERVCIEMTQLDDGVVDCPDASDELRKLDDLCGKNSECDGACTCGRFVEHSACANGSCVCDTGFKRSGNKKICIPRELSDSCFKDEDCTRVIEHSTCTDRICRCSTGYTANGTQSCRPMLLADQCRTDSECVVYNNNSVCQSSYCDCAVGYYVDNVTRTCVSRKLEEECSVNEDCSTVIPSSLCDNGTCSCVTGFRGNEDKDSCIKRKVSDICITDKDCSTVINNSLCFDNSCQCEENRKPVANNTQCLQNEIGDECNKETDCDLIANSFCKNGKCSCIRGFHNYFTNKTCILRKIFDKCDTNEDCFAAINSSVCVDGHCECTVEKIETDNNTSCRPRLLEDVCEYDIQCSSAIDSSLCPQGICKCVLGYQASDDNTTCTRRKVGDHTCSVGSDCSAAVYNSKCEMGVCKCISGYMVLENNTVCARRNISSPCAISSDCDDAMHYSACVNYSCACESGYKAVSNSACELRILDDVCDIDSDCFDAVSNSNCSVGFCKCNSGYKPFKRSAEYFITRSTMELTSPTYPSITRTTITNELKSPINVTSLDIHETLLEPDSYASNISFTEEEEESFVRNNTNYDVTTLTTGTYNSSDITYSHGSSELLAELQEIGSNQINFSTLNFLDFLNATNNDNKTNVDFRVTDDVNVIATETATQYENETITQNLKFVENTDINNISSEMDVVEATPLTLNVVSDSTTLVSLFTETTTDKIVRLRKKRNPADNIVTCVPRKLSDYCQVDTDCSDSVAHSFCKNNLCACSQGFYQGNSSFCNANKIWNDCTEDADCYLAVKDSRCLNGKCRCQGGFQVNNDKTFCNRRRIFDNTCQVSADCSSAVPFSMCFQGQCICNTGYFATNDNQTCTKFKIGDKCHNVLDCKESVSRSSCVRNTCVCVDGYMAVNGNTECQKRIISDPCTVEEHCSAAVFRSICTNNTCSCREGYDPIPELTSCVSSPRKLLDGCTFNAQCERLANQSVCGSLWGSRLTTCVCTTGLFVRTDRNANGECYAPQMIGDYCQNRAWCQLGENVLCEANECVCRLGYLPNATFDGCIRNPIAVGEFCRSDEHCSKISNSFCYENNTCQCHYKYKPSSDNRSCDPRPFRYVPDEVEIVRGEVCDNRTRRPCILGDDGLKYERCAMEEGHSENRCLCVPGYVSKFNAEKFKCQEIQTYFFSILITHELGCIDGSDDVPVCYIYQPINVPEDYNNETSEYFLGVRDRIVLQGFAHLFMDTQPRVKDRYMNSEVINITETSDGMQIGVLIYLLADYYNIINETELESEMIESLIRTHGEIGKSQFRLSWPFDEAIVYRDFNECTEQGGRFSDCSGIAWCLNTRVSYMCSCRHGYEDWSPDSDNRPGRICELPQDITTDSLSCSDGKCENQWEYISLALVGFGFMLFFFIGYEIYARKKKLEKSDIYYKLQKARIKEVRERRKTIRKKKKTEEKMKKSKLTTDEEKQLVNIVNET